MDSCGYGYNFFTITISDDNNNLNYCTVTVSFNLMDPGGIEDYINISTFQSTFSEGDPLHTHANFYDEDPYGDFMTDWFLKMEIYPLGQTTTYQYFDQSGGGPGSGGGPYIVDWYFNAPQITSNGPFARNQNGQIQGLLTVWGTDNEYYSHTDTRLFGINKEPDQPILVPSEMTINNVTLSYLSSGATNYTIYYGTQPGGPYNGVGADQGSSPIDAGTDVNFQISGLQTCIPYYFVVKGTNQYGNSVYSNEVKIVFFATPNQNPVYYFVEDLNIRYNWTITRNYSFSQNLVIEPGITLTVNGSYLYFTNGSKIIVKPGGRLILNGAYCGTVCGETWQGAEVWGNYNQNQYTINGQCAQGKIEINNGTIIENAYNAIAVWHPGNYLSSGGIILANNSTFKNNRRAIEFISYHNTHPVSGKIVSNASYFNQCTFLTNNDYLFPTHFYAFITMWDVEGISLRGCSFTNSSSISSSSERGYGIYTENASYQVTDLCTSLMSPCPAGSLLHTSYVGLNSGIKAMNTSYAKSINVNDAIFTNNSYGVNLKGANNSIVIKSYFDIGPNTNCPNFTGIGINLENCSNYCIEENSFTHSPGGPTGATYLGTRISYNSDFYGQDVPITELYKNSYSDITVGNQAEKYNINPNNLTGLSYICNNYEDNEYDVFVKDKGIAMYQGSSSIPAGNCFSKNGNNPASDFNNMAVWPVDYYYHGYLSCQYPEFRYNVFVTGITPSNSCPSHFSGGGTPSFVLTQPQLSAYELDFNNQDRKYDSINSIYLSLLDNGSTMTLTNQIMNATSQDANRLRASLLRISPFLSGEVLKNVIERSDIYADTSVLKILIANPEELRNEELLSSLKDEFPSISDSVISILRAISLDTTAKTSFQKKLAFFDKSRTADANTIIRSIVSDSVYDISILRTWLDKLQSLNTDMQVVDLFLEEGNTTSALALLDSLPYIYSINDSVLVEFQLYQRLKNLQANLIAEGKKIFEVDSTQLLELEEIANSSKGIAGIQAQNILEFGFGNSYVDCAAAVENPKVKEGKFDNSTLIGAATEIKIKVYPNPASSQVTFAYSFPKSNVNSTLSISNSIGQLIKEFRLSSNSGILEWDAATAANGIYLYSLISGDHIQTGKMAIVH